MKIVEIFGENYRGKWVRSRTACRGVVTEDGRLLLSHESATGQWMIPGGGLEDGESERECCVREVAEETGLLIRASECVLEIDEYYESDRYVSLYFFGTVTGSADMKLTASERLAGMEPRWLPAGEALEIFSRHADCAGTDEMRRGLYLREYTALRELLTESESIAGGAEGDN